MDYRRKRNKKKPANKICVNLLLDETQLVWPEKDQNVYVAHEIVQIKPLFEREDTYRKFIESNFWIRKYFPNFKKSILPTHKAEKNNYWILRFIGFFLFLWPIEVIMRSFQTYYMQGHKTTETVSHTFLALHPKDYKTETMERLRSKCQKLGLLTNL